MREIEFRGWDIQHDCWVYGYYEDYMNAFGPHFATIHVKMDWNLNGSFKVMPESVGQYTGEKDKNGKKIYEGDILRWYEIGGSYEEVAVSWDYRTVGYFPMNSWRPSEPVIIGNTWENKKTPVKEF